MHVLGGETAFAAFALGDAEHPDDLVAIDERRLEAGELAPPQHEIALPLAEGRVVDVLLEQDAVLEHRRTPSRSSIGTTVPT